MTEPEGPQEGDTYIHPDNQQMFYYTNDKWVDITSKDPYEQFPKPMDRGQDTKDRS